MKRILIVEDDQSIAAGLALNLRVEGYEAHIAADGAAALVEVARLCPALVILDLALPKKNGLEVLAELRRSGDRTPIVILSARDAEADVVAALKLGADDYVSKPFGLAELLARVTAVLRRSEPTQALTPAPGPADSGSLPVAPGANVTQVPGLAPETLVVGDLVIAVAARTVFRAGKELKLTRLEFDLLVYFAKNAGTVLSRERLLREVWDVHHDGSARTVDNFVAQLRAKIEDDPEHPRALVTVRGAGYRMETEPS
jgi:DNA-binding response OmpR family regulator